MTKRAYANRSLSAVYVPLTILKFKNPDKRQWDIVFSQFFDKGGNTRFAIQPFNAFDDGSVS